MHFLLFDYLPLVHFSHCPPLPACWFIFFFFFFFVELLPRLLWPSPNLKHSYSSIRLSGSAFALMHVSRSLLKPISPHLTKSALFHCKSSYCTAPPPTCISMCLCLVPKHFPINLHQPVSHFLKLLFKSFSRFPLLPDKYSVEHFVFFYASLKEDALSCPEQSHKRMEPCQNRLLLLFIHFWMTFAVSFLHDSVLIRLSLSSCQCEILTKIALPEAWHFCSDLHSE